MSSFNRLGVELSPYLRQHKDNPVHWYPWGEEAIQRCVDSINVFLVMWVDPYALLSEFHLCFSC